MPAHVKRRTLTALIATAIVGSTLGSSSASACCLADWLYGRQPAYAASPVPITTDGLPYTASFAPYSAGYAPYTAGYTPLLTGPTAASAYSVQRPAYGAVPLDNPSVYTGLPVTSGYRGLSTAGNSFYGTGNVYPNNYPSAGSSVAGSSVTALRPVVGSTQQFATPVRSGLARFFDSLLGTGYRTSYYTAPITYYRPATSIDPITGTTVTVQQPCSSSVQQLQRTPYTTFQSQSVGAFASNELQPCGGIACDDGMGLSYGASPIGSSFIPNSAPSAFSPGTTLPSTTSPSSISPYGGTGGFDAGGFSGGGSLGGDFQPLAPPTLPAPTFSGRPDLSATYPPADDRFSSPGSNLSPLTGGDSFRSDQGAFSYDAQDTMPSSSDRSPLRAPELQSARPATPDVDPNEAYRKGYEAGRAAIQDSQGDRTLQDNYDAYRYETEPAQRNESPRPPVRSLYDLDPPENSRPSTDEPLQRSRYEIDRDRRDLRDLTTQNEQPNPAWHRVRPIPAPEDYRNPFTDSSQPVSQTGEATSSLAPPSYRPDADAPLKAPDFLPALPRPSTQFNPGYERPSRFQGEQRLSVPVREASLQAAPARTPVLPPRVIAGQPTGRSAGANAWQTEVRKQGQETGWYATGN